MMASPRLGLKINFLNFHRCIISRVTIIVSERVFVCVCVSIGEQV